MPVIKVQDDIFDSSCVWAGKRNEYRYVLRRSWDDSKPKIVFIGLNPSTADERTDDNTVRKCINVARRDGFGRMVMLNAFAYRSTDPSFLKKISEVIGEGNDLHILEECKGATKVVVAWGNHAGSERHAKILEILRGTGLWCFALNKNRTPKHPLYVSNNAPLVPYLPL